MLVGCIQFPVMLVGCILFPVMLVGCCLRMVSSEDDREENIGASEEFERDFNEGSEKEQKNVTI